MFTLRPPHILCITTASLMNTIVTPDGAFNAYGDKLTVLIGVNPPKSPNQLSQPLAIRSVRQVNIDEIHQLEPHAKCSRDSHAPIYEHAASCPCCAPPVLFRSHPSFAPLRLIPLFTNYLTESLTRKRL
ncbi:hypothetical protein Y032_0153g2917 [Ancylostoma ceylanicum]|uniref:Uncharacterized protein n=1 Tax=Ancylostoma ceylanicum TaxID=53326 RepID=A0A016SZH5_9BILA|nr:hypothetical protein Y032_0153g2917 [Ancylostoma ceylanicum]